MVYIYIHDFTLLQKPLGKQGHYTLCILLQDYKTVAAWKQSSTTKPTETKKLKRDFENT